MIETLPLRRIFVPHFCLSLSPVMQGRPPCCTAASLPPFVAMHNMSKEGGSSRDNYRNILSVINNISREAIPLGGIIVADGATRRAITAAPNARPPAARRRAPGNDGHRASTWPGYVGAERRFT